MSIRLPSLMASATPRLAALRTTALRTTALGTTALTTAVLTAAALFAPAVTRAEPITRVDSTVDIPCRGAVQHRNASWHIPAGEPEGLVWLQHGCARTEAHVADLAARLAEAGHLVFTPGLPFLDPNGCTLQNLTGNRDFLGGVAALLAEATDPAGALATSLRAALAEAGRTPTAPPAPMVFLGHSAGAEAVTYVAHRLSAEHPGAWTNLRGLILLDPVKSFVDNNTDAALAALDHTELPIWTIAAAPSWCNSFGDGLTAVRTHLHRPFLGVRLPGGTHVDAEGASADVAGSLLCGTPRQTEVSTLATLAVGWAEDCLAGTTTARLYPDAAGRLDAAPGAQVLQPI
ncbi:hypothetical protein [Nocardia farcinica]|uniref:hypothetical protein n=1 Tax=Nocardia farcinica TaxID=37329 RepID=UPI002457C2A9|nr:hypothetical protein [Nocardia farcinica]